MMQRNMPYRRLVMIVLWPSFLMSCVATGLFFSMVDPSELVLFDRPVTVSLIGAYTIGFFVFWLLGVLSSTLTALLVADAHSSPI
jgi:hypothetical protein